MKLVKKLAHICAYSSYPVKSGSFCGGVGHCHFEYLGAGVYLSKSLEEWFAQLMVRARTFSHDAGGGGGDASSGTTRTNNAGDSHCYSCGKHGH